MAEVDIEHLIILVQERPVLWDKTIEEYKDRVKSRNAWIDIFKELNSDFQELGDKEKNEYGKYNLVYYL